MRIIEVVCGKFDVLSLIWCVANIIHSHAYKASICGGFIGN